MWTESISWEIVFPVFFFPADLETREWEESVKVWKIIVFCWVWVSVTVTWGLSQAHCLVISSQRQHLGKWVVCNSINTHWVWVHNRKTPLKNFWVKPQKFGTSFSVSECTLSLLGSSNLIDVQLIRLGYSATGFLVIKFKRISVYFLENEFGDYRCELVKLKRMYYSVLLSWRFPVILNLVLFWS